MNATPGRRITFKIDAIFPLADSKSVPLLKLMTAADDVRHLHKLLLTATAQSKEASELDKVILDAEILHIFRLITGHLYEAGKAFHKLDRASSDLLNNAVANDKERKADLTYLRQVFAPAGSFLSRFLGPIRHLVFHYKDRELRAALESAKDFPSSLIVARYAHGLGRYKITDDIATAAIARELRLTDEDYPQKFGEAMLEVHKGAWALARLVDHLLFQKFEERSDAIIRQKDGEIVVRPEWLPPDDKRE